MKRLQAGAAKCCITPPERMMPAYSFLPIRLSRVYRDIYVRALVLDNGERTFALVAIESGDLGRIEELRRALETELGLSREDVLLTVTHTHEAPTFAEYHKNVVNDPEKLAWVMGYGDFVIAQTVACVRQAMAERRYARWGCHTGTSWINISRDQQYEDGSWDVGFAPEEPSDKDLFVMEVQGDDGRCIALLVNYAVHGTACFMGMDDQGEHYLLSGDLPGMISAYLEERLAGDKAVALWTSGAAGDQAPVFMPTYERFCHDGTHETAFGTGGACWQLCEHLAQVQAVDVLRTRKEIRCTQDGMRISTVERTLPLPLEGGTEGETVPLPLKLVTLNDVALFGVGGELVSTIGRKLKEAAPLKTLVIINHIDRRIQYLPDRRQYHNRTFAGRTTMVRDGCTEDYLLPAMQEMFEQRFKS